jgi:hypothetical protein
LALGNKADLLEIGRAKQVEAGTMYGEGHAKQEVLSTNDKSSEQPVEAKPNEPITPWLSTSSMDDEDFTAEDFADVVVDKPINTQKALAKDAGVSTGKLAQAEVVRRDAQDDVFLWLLATEVSKQVAIQTDVLFLCGNLLPTAVTKFQ